MKAKVRRTVELASLEGCCWPEPEERQKPGTHLTPKLLQLPSSLQSGSLHVLQRGPQLSSLLGNSHASLFQEGQLLLLVLISKLQAARQRPSSDSSSVPKACPGSELVWPHPAPR